MKDDDLSPMPTPYAEEPQLVPGGVDAIEDDPADNGLPRDLSTDDNPAVGFPIVLAVLAVVGLVWKAASKKKADHR